MKTAIFDEHVKAGGRMVTFGGWELPVQYSGALDEYKACRERAGLFDVSHMGEFEISGKDSADFLNWALTNQVKQLPLGKALYTVLCFEHGGIVDDLIVYRKSENDFLLIVNAANTDKDWAYLESLRSKFSGRDLKMKNSSSNFSLLALQGRLAQKILQPFASGDVAAISYYSFKEMKVMELPALVSRTGYTGEDGFEILIPWSEGARLWGALLETGSPLGLKPCGLAVRDLLRIEMKFPLYGQELSETTNPLEAGLGWVVKMDKPDFVGKSALLEIRARGIQRKLVGFALKDKGVPRTGYGVFNKDGSKSVGEVTSGTHSPSLECGIGIAYVEASEANIGGQILIDCRGRKLLGEIVKTPFFKRNY